MTGRRTRRHATTAACAALVALPFVRLALVARALPSGSIPWGADNVELLLSAQSAAHLDQLTGPWSRLGFTHPGPLLAYWEAPWFLAMGHAPSSLMVAAAVLGGVCFAALVAVVGVRTAPAGAAVAAIVVLAGLARADVVGFAHPWNPAATMAASALLLVVAAAVSTGSVRLLPVLVLVGSFVAQTHLGAAPFAVVVTGAALVAGFRRHEDAWRNGRRWVAAAGAVGLLVWLPVGIDQVSGTHNASRLLGFAVSGEVRSDDFGVLDPDTDREVGAADAVRWTAAVASGAQPSASRWAGSDAVAGLDVRPEGESLLVLGALVAANVWAVARSRRVLRTPAAVFAASLSRFAVAGTVLCAVAAWNSRGDFRPYLVAFGVGVGMVLWLGAVLGAGLALRPVVGPAWDRIAPKGIGRAAAGAVAVVAMIALLVPSMTHRLAAFPSADAESRALHAAVEDRLPAGFDGWVELRGHGFAQYPRLLELVFALESDGIRTQVPERFQLRASTRQRRSAPPAVEFVLGGRTVPPPAGCEPVPVGDGSRSFPTTLCVIEH